MAWIREVMMLVILSTQYSLFLALPADVGKKAAEPYSFDDIFDPLLRPRGFSANWIPGEDKFYYRNATTGNLYKYDAEEDTAELILSNDVFTTYSGTYFISPTGTYILFAINATSLWRHSFNARYRIVTISTPDVVEVFPHGPLADEVLEFAGWGKSSSSDALSFVYGHNLYYQGSPTENAIQITDDGHETDIFNGVPDWLYEEDVVSERVTHYWSPDNSFICYAKINDSLVPLQDWPVYGDKTNVFGSTRQIRYPKAGDVTVDGKEGPNSVVEIFVANVTDPNNIISIPISPPDEFQTISHYYLQVAWVNDDHVYITWANRVQNHSISVMYDVTQGTATKGLEYTTPGGWVEVPPPTPWFIDETHYITIHPQPVPATGPSSTHWRHLTSITLGANIEVTSLMNDEAEEEVDYIYGYDPVDDRVKEPNKQKKTDELQAVVVRTVSRMPSSVFQIVIRYYSSTAGDPTERHIVRVAGPGSTNRTSECLTCGMSASCRYITSSFSSSTKHYFVNCRGPEIPTFTLRSTIDDTKQKVFEDNADVWERLSGKDLPVRDFRHVPIGGGYLAEAEIFTPPNHQNGNQYPLLMYVYAGPGSQRVAKTFPIGGSTNNWLTYLKSTHKVVVASVDSRGALGRGDKFKFEMYRNLGTVEVQDQIMAGGVFQGNPFIDAQKRSAIFGWSYGGGTTAHVIGDPSTTFMCGISVAPVTTKAYYDTAYTERYLGLATPDDDPLGYNNTDVMNKVQNFRNKKFMINHGIADDNVHFMHATQLIRALSDADIMFRQNVYVDQNHNINSPGQSRHLYHTMTEFLINDCWNGNEEPTEPPMTTVDPNASGDAATLSTSVILLLFSLLTIKLAVY